MAQVAGANAGWCWRFRFAVHGFRSGAAQLFSLDDEASGYMLCQRCQQRQAAVHIAEGHGDNPVSAFDGTSFTLHFCAVCGEEYQQGMFAKVFPSGGKPPIIEQLRVIQSSPERTIVRLVRTESQPVPEDWSLLTSRLPEDLRVVGKEFGLALTPSEFEFMRGDRDLP